MKRIIKIVLVVSILVLTNTRVKAESPYTTWAPGPGGYWYQTQDAYSPSAEVNLPISAAEDFFVTAEGWVYVADTGNGRILKLQDFEVVATYGEGILQGPTGLFVDADGVIYVADAKQNLIFIFGPDGVLLKQFGRPVEPLFGASREFLPRKIAVDARQNMYIISEGSVHGIIQMNTSGNFLGYFGANPASMSLKMILQRIFLTPEQLAQFIKNEAASPSNIAIDQQSLVYTVTSGTVEYKSIRKFTISGKNIFPETYGSTTFRDLHVSEAGLLLAVDSTGQIYEYDTSGTLLFAFGAQDRGEQRLGTLANPVAIERYQDDIYVLDKDKNVIVVYHTTDFAKLVHDGVRLYMNGYYSEAKPYFDQVLTYNGSFIMSYQAIADAYYKAGDHLNALAAYRYAEDRNGYSQAFWELRNSVLQRYLGQALLWLLGLWVVQVAARRLDRRFGWSAPLRNWLRGLQRFRLVDDFVFMFRFIKQPADSFYYIKKDLRGSLAFATLVYVAVVAARVLSLYFTGFSFNPYASLSYIPVESEVVKTVLLIFLWNAANYLVSTISDGEGRVRDVVIGSAYSLFPYVLFTFPLALASNLLTLNEVFVYTFSQDIIWFWTGLMLFIMVKEVHNYSVSETIKNILVTLFTMAMFLLTAYILYVLFNQLFEFVSAIIQEAGLRG